MWGGWNPFAQQAGGMPGMAYAQMAGMGYGMPPQMANMMMFNQMPGAVPVPMPQAQPQPGGGGRGGKRAPQRKGPVHATAPPPFHPGQQMRGNRNNRRNNRRGPPNPFMRGAKRRKLRDPRLDIMERERARKSKQVNLAGKDFKYETFSEAPGITLRAPTEDELHEAVVRYLRRDQRLKWVPLADVHQRMADSVGFGEVKDYGKGAKELYDEAEDLEVEERETPAGRKELFVRYKGDPELDMDTAQPVVNGVRKIPLVQVSMMKVGELKAALRERKSDTQAKRPVLIEMLREMVKQEIEAERSQEATKAAQAGKQVIDLTKDKGKKRKSKEDAPRARKKRKVQAWVAPYSPSASTGIYGAYQLRRRQLRVGAKIRVMFGKNRGRVARVLGQRPDRRWDALLLSQNKDEQKRSSFYEGSIRVVGEDAVSCELQWHPPLGNAPLSSWPEFPNEPSLCAKAMAFLDCHLWARYPSLPGEVVLPIMPQEAIKFFRKNFLKFQVKQEGLFFYVRNAECKFDSYKLECDVCVAEAPLWKTDANLVGEVKEGKVVRLLSTSVGNGKVGAFMITPTMGWCQFDKEDHTAVDSGKPLQDAWLDGTGFHKWKQLPLLLQVAPTSTQAAANGLNPPQAMAPDAETVAKAATEADRKKKIIANPPFPKIMKKNIHDWTSGNCATWVMSLKIHKWAPSTYTPPSAEDDEKMADAPKGQEEEKAEPKAAEGEATAAAKKPAVVDLTKPGVDYKASSDAFRKQVDGSNILDVTKVTLMENEAFKFTEKVADSIWLGLQALREYNEVYLTTPAGQTVASNNIPVDEMGLPIDNTKGPGYPNEEFCPGGYKHCLPVNVRWFHKGAVAKVFSGQKGFTKQPLYNKNHSILVLGESDFSFTQSFIRAFGNCHSQVVGSSYMLKRGHGQNPHIRMRVTGDLSRRFLDTARHPGQLEANLNEIVNNGGLTRFGVDAKDLEGSLMKPAREQKVTVPQKFDRIVFPFPRASLKKYDRKLDPELIRETLRSGSKVLSPDGEIHIIVHFARNGINQFDLWCMRETAEEIGFVWRAGLPIDWKDLTAYHPKDVTGKDWTPTCCYLLIFTPQKDSNGKPWKWPGYSIDKTYKYGHDLGPMPDRSARDKKSKKDKGVL